MQIVPIEPMKYKEQIKHDELLTKLRIVKLVLLNKYSRVKVARIFGCHRHTVETTVLEFQTKLDQSIQDKLINDNNWQIDDLKEALKPLLNKSRTPIRHKYQATEEQEGVILWLFFEECKVGSYRLKTLINRRFYDSKDPLLRSMVELSAKQVRNIYHRYDLKVEKVRSSTGQAVPIYDYTELACFEKMHFDTKHILDQKALPRQIYQQFKLSNWMPRYQWTFQDAKSRFRFIAYSRHINSEYGLKYLVFCLMYIRYTFNNWHTKINIGFDHGVENCSGSTRKLADWNHILSLVNAKAYQYHLGNDIRKNIIERSHKTDDEEFFVPRASAFINKPSFIKEATGFNHYFNFSRPHRGVSMNDRTPLEVLEHSGLIRPEKLMEFPIMILDDEIDVIRKTTDCLLYQAEMDDLGGDVSQKTKIDVALKYDFFDNEIVQNVLASYPRSRLID